MQWVSACSGLWNKSSVLSVAQSLYQIKIVHDSKLSYPTQNILWHIWNSAKWPVIGGWRTQSKMKRVIRLWNGLLEWSVCKNLRGAFACSSQGGKSGAVQKCSACRGRGVRIMIRQLAPGMVQQMQSVCADCNGEGTRASTPLWGRGWGGAGSVGIEEAPDLSFSTCLYSSYC